jgi:hypothetical protein
MKMLYRAAQVSVSLGRLIAAAYYFLIGLLLLAFALWLVLPLGQSWLMMIIAACFALSGCATLVKASEIFLTTKPLERPTKGQQDGRR